ncbi:MAG: hypothetical protein ABR990_08515 [Terracidiphilus sp.]
MNLVLNPVLLFLLHHADLFRILPEVVLTLTGVLVMLLDATIPPHWARRSLGWVAAFGTMFALWASQCQLALPEGTGFSGTVETSAFTVFFHVLICGIVLVALLLSLDTLPAASFWLRCCSRSTPCLKRAIIRASSTR